MVDLVGLIFAKCHLYEEQWKLAEEQWRQDNKELHRSLLLFDSHTCSRGTVQKEQLREHRSLNSQSAMLVDCHEMLSA